MLHQFTFITIAYEESDELVKTFNSIKQLLSSGSNWVLVINQGLKDFSPPENTKIIEGKDNSLYDALNLGLSEVSTDYFMLIHAGDEISDLKAFCRAASCLNDHYDYILGGAYIGNRLHMSKNWKRWMFRFYVQPPHLPIIYKTQSCIQDRYNVHISTVADFIIYENYSIDGTLPLNIVMRFIFVWHLEFNDFWSKFIYPCYKVFCKSWNYALLLSPLRFYLKSY